MKRVNLLEYLELAESAQTAKRALSLDKARAADIYFGVLNLGRSLDSFTKDDTGFGTSKRLASELSAEIAEFTENHAFPRGEFNAELFNEELNSWEWGGLAKKLDMFRSVLEAECHDVDIYSVGQISIYKTADLVSAGSNIIPNEYHSEISPDALREFDNAGKCLAFDLPTACGFHALRGLELMMGDYLSAFGVSTKRLRTWNMYIQAAKKLIDEPNTQFKPSAKVAAMLDRMRELDRNPLMHPRDTLDSLGADQLFKLCAITICEMVRDLRGVRQGKAVAAIAHAAKADLP